MPFSEVRLRKFVTDFKQGDSMKAFFKNVTLEMNNKLSFIEHGAKPFTVEIDDNKFMVRDLKNTEIAHTPLTLTIWNGRTTLEFNPVTI